MSVSNYVSFDKVWHEELEEALEDLDFATFSKMYTIYTSIEELSNILCRPSFRSTFSKKDIYHIKYWIVSSFPYTSFESSLLFKGVSNIKNQAFLIKKNCQNTLDSIPSSFKISYKLGLNRLADHNSYVTQAMSKKSDYFKKKLIENNETFSR
jgi:hypothetical protein